MHIPKLLAAALLVSMATAHAAPRPYTIIDHSTEAVMTKDSALAIWKSQVDAKTMARLIKLYPATKWGFISQVEGGFTTDKVCVITARAMMVPRITGGRLVFKPSQTATAFGAQAGATLDQCKELAATKLKEAVASVGSSLVKS